MGFLLSVSAPADAAWRRFNAAMCTPMMPGADFRYSDGQGGLFLFTGSGGGYDFVACPVIEDSTLWVDAVTGLTVTVRNASNAGVLVAACVKSDNALSGTCGFTASSSAIGLLTLTPGLNAWQKTFFGEANAGDYPYLSVGLAHTGGVAMNAIAGYHITN